jgi:hypothetical protein
MHGARLVFFLMPAFVCCGRSVTPLVTVAKCPDEYSDCITMALDADSLPAIQVGEAVPSDSGYSSFVVNVTGSLDGGPAAQAMTVVGYTDGIACSAFGQASVAVVGFTADRQPIVLTSAGPLSLESKGLIVGCPACAQLLSRSGSPGPATAVTPSWDVYLRGAGGRISYADDGSLFVEQGARCLRVPVSGGISEASDDDCAGAEIADPGALVPAIPLQRDERLIEAPRSAFVLRLRQSACT